MNKLQGIMMHPCIALFDDLLRVISEHYCLALLLCREQQLAAVEEHALTA
jgi:hypothetical protein